jgi:hypothetical protein
MAMQKPRTYCQRGIFIDRIGNRPSRGLDADSGASKFEYAYPAESCRIPYNGLEIAIFGPNLDRKNVTPILRIIGALWIFVWPNCSASRFLSLLASLSI